MGLPAATPSWQAMLVMALVTLGAHAEEGKGMSPRTTVAYLAPAQAAAEPMPRWFAAFRATVAADLQRAGGLRLMNPPPGPLEAAPGGPLREDEAQWCLRTVARPGLHGKVLMECQGVRQGRRSPPFDKVFVGTTSAWAQLAHRVTDYVVGSITGTAGVASSEIVFSRRTGAGVSEIFGSDRDGQHLRKITTFGSVSTYPALAADGRLALVTFKGGPPQIWGQVRTMGPMARLFPPRGDNGMGISDLAWAPDGSRIAFILEDRAGTAGLHLLDPRTGKVSRLTPEGHRAKCPSWNPLGTALAYVSDQEGVPQVFIVDADGRGCRQVTHDVPSKGYAAWSPAGDRIAYAASTDGGTALLTVSPDGQDRHQVSLLAKSVVSLCWAPDARGLLLGLKRGGDFQLGMTDLDGTSRKLADGLADSPLPQWTRNPPHLALLSQADSPAAHQDHAHSGAPSHL